MARQQEKAGGDGGGERERERIGEHRGLQRSREKRGGESPPPPPPPPPSSSSYPQNCLERKRSYGENGGGEEKTYY